MTATITGAVLEGGPFDLVEPDDGWPLVLATYRLTVYARAEIPDYIGALIAYWRGLSSIAAIVPSASIRGKIPAGTPAFTPYLVPTKAGGSEDPYAPILRPRIDVRCYGKTEYEAMRLFRVVHPTLIPIDRRSFTITI